MAQFAEKQRERGKHFEKSKRQDRLFVLSDIPAAIVRLNISNPELSKMGSQLSKGELDNFSNLPFVANLSGKMCLDMSRFGEMIKSADLKKDGNIEVLGELFIILDRDMVLKGESAYSTVE